MKNYPYGYKKMTSHSNDCDCHNDYEYDYDYHYHKKDKKKKKRPKKKLKCDGCVCNELKHKTPVEIVSISINGVTYTAGSTVGSYTIDTITAVCFNPKTCCLTILLTGTNGAGAAENLQLIVDCEDIDYFVPAP